jgi:hypothetical protein
MKSIRRKMWLQAAVASTCLFEAVGCPQLIGNAIKSGTRSFLDTGLTTAILTALDLETLLGSTGL